MGDLSIFAERLKEARIQRDMKQNELAKAIGVSAQTISMYEKSEKDGKGKNPTLENALAIAEKLNVSLDWLCGKDYVEEQINKGREKPFTKWFVPVCKYLYIPVCFLVLILGIALGGIG